MILKPILISGLADFALRGSVNEFKIALENSLKKYFFLDKDNTYRILSNRLIYINDIILGIKEKFGVHLGNAPIPVSFLIFSEKGTFRNLELIRAGKVYVEKTVKTEVEKELENLNIYYKFFEWEEDWFELVLPSTADPKLLFFYKDVFFSGSYPFCFFCGSTHHKFVECPGLFETEPRRLVEKALEMSFSELSQRIWEGVIIKGSQDLKYYFVRHFYLFPEFLKVIFFKGEGIESWVSLKINIETPVKGGDLGLGLEALVRKDLKTAEIKFSEVENDLRAQLGLFFVNLLRNEWDKSIYFLENALVHKTNNFVKSYLFFLKGYLYEYKRDEVLAQEFYKKALDIDRTCFPAFYRLTLVRYLRGEPLENILTYFEHPLFIFWTALEPFFIKDEAYIEEFIERKILEKREQALQRLREAEDTYHKIKSILSKEEKQGYEEKLKKISTEIYTKGLGGIEKAGEKALTLTLELQAFIYNKIKEIQNKVNSLEKKYESLFNFWNGYPYKEEDINFGQGLKMFGSMLERLSYFIKRKDISQQFSVVFSTVQEAEELVKKLEIIREDLKKKWLFRKRLADFIKCFSFLEMLLVSLYILVYFGEISELQKFLTIPIFFGISSLFLLFCLVFAYYKNPEL